MGKAKIKGKKELEKKLRNMSDAARRDATQEALYSAAAVVHGQAVSLCPVDTGNLRISLHFEVFSDYAEVGTPVEYSPFVELGTARMAAQPYLRPSLDALEPKLPKLAGDIYMKHLRRA